LTKEQIKKIKQEYSEGNITQKELSKKYNVVQQTINYHVNDKEKEKRKRDVMIRYRKLPKTKRREIYESKKEYIARYFKNRYKTDIIFREKHKERVREYNKKKRRRG